tara:strand:- start:203 stop:463 length:261 start_codon:yes stop_codon:yes gene_type:complete
MTSFQACGYKEEMLHVRYTDGLRKHKHDLGEGKLREARVSISRGHIPKMKCLTLDQSKFQVDSAGISFDVRLGVHLPRVEMPMRVL